MDRLRHLGHAVRPVLHLDGKPLAAARAVRFGGHIPHPVCPLGRMETLEKQARTRGAGMGGRHPLCAHRRVFHQSVRVSELPNPHGLARENAPRGRLPFRQQTELWAACTQHAPLLPAGAKHDAILQLQVLPRLAALGLQAGQRPGACAAQRHRGLQPPHGRHRGPAPAEPGLLLAHARERVRRRQHPPRHLRQDRLPACR